MTILITPFSQSQAIAQETSKSTAVKPAVGQAQGIPAPSVKGLKVTFNPPAGDKPKISTGGASRSHGQCINQAENSALPFAALIPTSALGLTVASHPTLLAYLPETNASKVLFSWQDENNQEHYQTILPIENKTGIISLTLPEDAPPLEVGKNYQWALAVMCDGRLQPDSPMIQGQIKRVEITSSLSDRLKNANPLETAALYAEAGIWYETVATLAQLTANQPNNSDIKSNWQNLLTSVGLEKVATTPLVK
ncbi:MAG: DUF928 domain-containing protein [Waterburya sp.]